MLRISRLNSIGPERSIASRVGIGKAAPLYRLYSYFWSILRAACIARPSACRSEHGLSYILKGTLRLETEQVDRRAIVVPLGLPENRM
jgi:hypothetical protein